DLLRVLVGFGALDFSHCLQCALRGLFELLERLLGETLLQAELGGALRAGNSGIKRQEQLLGDFRLFRHFSGPPAPRRARHSPCWRLPWLGSPGGLQPAIYAPGAGFLPRLTRPLQFAASDLRPDATPRQ